MEQRHRTISVVLQGSVLDAPLTEGRSLCREGQLCSILIIDRSAWR